MDHQSYPITALSPERHSSPIACARSHPLAPPPLRLAPLHAAATPLLSLLTQSGTRAASPDDRLSPDTPTLLSLSTVPHLPSGTVAPLPPGCRDAARTSPPSVLLGPNTGGPFPLRRFTVIPFLPPETCSSAAPTITSPCSFSASKSVRFYSSADSPRFRQRP